MSLLPRPRRTPVLALGVYLSDQLNLAPVIARALDRGRRFRIDQRWVAVGAISDDPFLARRTAAVAPALVPKFELLGRLLREAALENYEYLALVDDDVELPDDFVDRFFGLQARFGFALAQPARSEDSFIDLPIVERHPGLLARETLFVEQGPIASFHRSAFAHVLPFDETSPMGWGLENVWSLALSEAGLRLGIIDAAAVRHRLRPPLRNYVWDTADQGRQRLFASRRHRPTAECFRVLCAHAAADA